MKILLVAARRWVKKNDKLFKKIITTLKETNHEVLYEHNYVPYENETTEDKKKLAKQINKIRKKADIVIAEVSMPASGVGMEISESIKDKKPVLILYTKESESELSWSITAASKKRHVTKKVYNESNVKEILQDFLNKAKKKITRKYLLNIPPDIDMFLSERSEKTGLHKSQIIRKAIRKLMKENE